MVPNRTWNAQKHFVALIRFGAQWFQIFFKQLQIGNQSATVLCIVYPKWIFVIISALIIAIFIVPSRYIWLIRNDHHFWCHSEKEQNSKCMYSYGVLTAHAQCPLHWKQFNQLNWFIGNWSHAFVYTSREFNSLNVKQSPSLVKIGVKYSEQDDWLYCHKHISCVALSDGATSWINWYIDSFAYFMPSWIGFGKKKLHKW